jgi:hypothetical protein
MTITVANVDSTTDTFGGLITKVNVIADALTNKIVTTNSNTAVGNASVGASFTANAVYSNNFYGGNTSLTANITFNTNTIFIGSKTKLGLGANVQIDTGSSTVRILTVNSAASNTLVATKITFSDHSDVDVATSSPANTHTLAYNSANTTWYNKVGLVVYYANGVVAYP